MVLSYLGAFARVISFADACNSQYGRSLRLMYRHQCIYSACTGSLWHGARVGRRLSRGTRRPVSADLRVGPLSGQEWWYADPPNLESLHKLGIRRHGQASPRDRLPYPTTPLRMPAYTAPYTICVGMVMRRCSVRLETGTCMPLKKDLFSAVS